MPPHFMLLQLDEEQVELLTGMSVNNPFAYNANKAMEECIEFQEVIVKLQTKNKANPRRPKTEEAIGEYGDVIYRGAVHLMTLYPENTLGEIMEHVQKHINKKLAKLKIYKDTGTYTGGL